MIIHACHLSSILHRILTKPKTEFHTTNFRQLCSHYFGIKITLLDLEILWLENNVFGMSEYIKYLGYSTVEFTLL